MARAVLSFPSKASSNTVDPSGPQLTHLLRAWSEGDTGALEQLMPIVYDELHRLARQYMADERPEVRDVISRSCPVLFLGTTSLMRALSLSNSETILSFFMRSDGSSRSSANLIIRPATSARTPFEPRNLSS